MVAETSFGVFTRVYSRLPGSMRSGENPRWKSTPGTRPGVSPARRRGAPRWSRGRSSTRGRPPHPDAGSGRSSGRPPRRRTGRGRRGESGVGTAMIARSKSRAGLGSRRGVVPPGAARNSLPADRGQPFVGHVLDVGPAAPEELDLGGVQVDADHVVTDLGGPDRQGQADVTQTDDDDSAHAVPLSWSDGGPPGGRGLLVVSRRRAPRARRRAGPRGRRSRSGWSRR